MFILTENELALLDIVSGVPFLVITMILGYHNFYMSMPMIFDQNRAMNELSTNDKYTILMDKIMQSNAKVSNQ